MDVWMNVHDLLDFLRLCDAKRGMRSKDIGRTRRREPKGNDAFPHLEVVLERVKPPAKRVVFEVELGEGGGHVP